MLGNKCLLSVKQTANETQQIELEALGAAANGRAFPFNPDDGVHHNVFVDVWRWATRHFKRKHGDTHR